MNASTGNSMSVDNGASRVGVVAIGRNEGERLQRCLRSVVGQAGRVVYVDSGSTDDSVAFARSIGVHVIELDMSVPFTMARGRNTGYQWLRDNHPELLYTQFVDGDCELVEGWLDQGAQGLDDNDKAAAMSGRRRERHPEASVYNQIADYEWDTPVGEVKSCHGDVMMRNAALDAVGLFDETMICGEEPELSVRLRRGGWTLHRLDCEMTRHDAAMTRFGQWWKRSVRGGWAYAEGAARYGKAPERHNVKQRNSVLIYGLVIPLLSVVLAVPTFGLSVLLWLAYPFLGWRVYRYARHDRGWSAAGSRLYAWFVVLGKFPQLLGMMKFYWTRLRGKRATLIEYKSAAPSRERDSKSADDPADDNAGVPRAAEYADSSHTVPAARQEVHAE